MTRRPESEPAGAGAKPGTNLRAGALALLSVLGLFVLAPEIARAHPQVSARLATGGGARLGPEQSGGLFEMALRSEVLFGKPGDEHIRVGPAVSVRTATFRTLEPALGAALLVPTFRGYPLVFTAGAGHAFRRGRPDAPFALGTVAWSYRSYNFHSPYGFGLSVYVSARGDLDGSGRWEMTGGVEIDLAFLLAIPVAGIRTLFRRGDPDEPTD